MKKENAQSKIKKYLCNDNYKPIKITEGMIRLWWHVINAALFNNSLSIPLLEVQNSPKTIRGNPAYGRCYARCYTDGTQDLVVCLRRQMENRSVFIYVLAHELVHNKEWELKGGASHGDYFLSWREKFYNLLGFRLRSGTNPRVITKNAKRIYR